jgi:hypothetical protein
MPENAAYFDGTFPSGGMIVTDESRAAEPAAAIGATGATSGGGVSGADWQAASVRHASASTFRRMISPIVIVRHSA